MLHQRSLYFYLRSERYRLKNESVPRKLRTPQKRNLGHHTKPWNLYDFKLSQHSRQKTFEGPRRHKQDFNVLCVKKTSKLDHFGILI